MEYNYPSYSVYDKETLERWKREDELEVIAANVVSVADYRNSRSQ